MAYSGKVDQDIVFRAQKSLLGSGEISLARQIWAHRVLAEVSPTVHLPKLAEALLKVGHEEAGAGATGRPTRRSSGRRWTRPGGWTSRTGAGPSC